MEYEKRKRSMAVLQVRVDDELKNQATVIFDQLGIDLSTAVRMFLKKAVLEKGIPFETKIDEVTLRGILAMEQMRKISEENGNSKMSLIKGINKEIKKYRNEKKLKKK